MSFKPLIIVRDWSSKPFNPFVNALAISLDFFSVTFLDWSNAVEKALVTPCNSFEVDFLIELLH
ncbi:hypothetical protein KK420_18255 [Clostridioides difficile]|nr:hypothetical protein [Clostridioides difficile]